MTRKTTLCLWYNGTAEEAANFYAKTFPDSAVKPCAWHRAITLRVKRATSMQASTPSSNRP